MVEPPRTLKLVTIWLLLATIVFVGAQAVMRERDLPRVETLGRSVMLTRAADGHFHWPGRVNDREVAFLIDTGATRTTLPGDLARSLGLPRGNTVQTNTAAGPASGYTSAVSLALEGGPHIVRLPVTVMEAMDGPPLLGMDVLGRLSLEQSAGRMRLSPP